MVDPAPRLREAPPAGHTRLFLVRHGSTAANERKPFVLQGSEINGPLTPLGERQSAAVGRCLSEFAIHAVYASPLVRAQQTALAIATPHGLPVVPVADLRECSVGRWEGQSWEQIRERDPDGHAHFFADPVHTPHPGGESYADCLNRVAPALAAIIARHPSQNVVVVAHNMVNRVYLAGLVGIDLRNARSLRQMNCCINVLHVAEGKTDLVTMNSILHLDEL